MQKYTERKHFQDSESPSFQKGNKNLIVLEKDKARIQAHRNFQKLNLNFDLYRDPTGKKLGYLERFKKKKKKQVARDEVRDRVDGNISQIDTLLNGA